MEQHHLPVRRTARFYSLGPWDRAVAQLWFVLHGHSQLAGAFLEEFTGLNDGTRLIVAPEALSRFYLETTPHGRHSPKVGARWMTREDRLAEIADYLGYLDALGAHVIERLGNPIPDTRTLGFSQGGATACRWLSRGSTEVRELILWGSLFPEDVLPTTRESRWQARLVTLVQGTEDTLVPAALHTRQVGILRQNGVPSRELSFRGGHRLDPALLRALAEGAPA